MTRRLRSSGLPFRRTSLYWFLFIAAVLSASEGSATVTLRVAADGSADYTSIQKAIDAAPAGGAIIRIAPGTYREVLEITKSNLQLRGTSRDATKTLIVFDKNAGTAGGTTKSATVNVRSDDFSWPRISRLRTTSTPHILSCRRVRKH